MVGLGGLEPPTSRLSGVRSSHLSYKPNFWSSKNFLAETKKIRAFKAKQQNVS